MRSPQAIIAILKKTKDLSFEAKCDYINTLHITLNEVRQVNKKALKKIFPVKLEGLSSLVNSVPKFFDGYLEITSIHQNKVLDYGFLLYKKGDLDDDLKLITKEPPTIYNPLTYQFGLR